MGRRLTLGVPEAASVERLLAGRRTLGLATGRPDYQLLRDTYFDTTAGTLREGRMKLRLRVDASGHRSVTLATVSAVSLQGVFDETVLDEPLAGGGLYEFLRGPSELATRVREIVDPIALRPVAALDIDREARGLKAGWTRRTVHLLFWDRILAQGPGTTHAMQEITFSEVGSGGPALDRLADELRTRFGLAADGSDTLERAGRLAVPGPTVRSGTPQGVRGAVLILRDGAVALEDGPLGLTLPTTQGSGDHAARDLGHRLLGEVTPEPELVGFTQGKRDTPDLELWLLDGYAGSGGGAALVWIPLAELLERVGGPRLRDPALTAALLLLMRSEVGRRLAQELPPGRGRPTVLPPARRPRGLAPGDDPEDFLDAELSTLDFNKRVLELAEDPGTPLLERFRFLSIFSANMDEFFVVRVGRLKREARSQTGGEAAGTLLDAISVRSRALAARQYACLTGLLLPALGKRGVRIRRWPDLAPGEREGLSRRFAEEIFPVLTPRAMSAAPGHPFPRLTSLGLSLVAILRGDQDGRTHLAHVPLPEDLPRFLPVGQGPDLILLEDVVEANATTLFPAFEVQGIHAFRVSRLGEVDIDEEETDSFLSAVEDEVEARPYKPVVRMEVQADMPREVRALLLRELRSEPGTDRAGAPTRSDVFEVHGPVDLRGFSELCRLDPALGVFRGFSAQRPIPADRSILDYVGEGDVLVHHPYDSFDDTVGRFFAEAARDPSVVSIKTTVYRTGRTSPIIEALLEALRNGKDVSVFVELKARFDEESNLHWTHRLSEAGGHVVYGVVGYKTHAKTALVVRREASGVRRYVHVGTGNYNSSTARLYTDLGLLSADPELGADLSDFFNELTGSSGPPAKAYRRLWVAPTSLVTNLVRCIDREIEHARAGRPASIQAKLNGIADREMVGALYRAASEGVQVDLIVRAICTLRPGVEGLSHGIRVRSILGRFLEHARVYRFANGGTEEFYIGSADWRHRNLRRRVEVVAPVTGAQARDRLRRVLELELASGGAWVLRPDGAYERVDGPGDPAQQILLRSDQATAALVEPDVSGA